MTSFRQIEANRRNALASSGPKTGRGKQQSRRNAMRHGLTAETVIDVLEDMEDYKAFELSITSDFDARTAVERELVLRLASLLWRLRRSTAIETGLLQIQSEIMREADRRGRNTRVSKTAVATRWFVAVAGYRAANMTRRTNMSGTQELRAKDSAFLPANRKPPEDKPVRVVNTG
jgi:hypothetical protein